LEDRPLSPKLDEIPCEFTDSGEIGRPALNLLWIAGATNLALSNWLAFWRQGDLRNVREFRGWSASLFRIERSHGPKMCAGEAVATQVLLEIGPAIRNIVFDILGGEDAHT